MSDEKHTKEPWYEGMGEQNGLPCVDAYDEEGHFIEICECWGDLFYEEETEQSRANARRIVAAVNAVAGIPTEELESISSCSSQWGRLDELGEAAFFYANKGDTK